MTNEDIFHAYDDLIYVKITYNTQSRGFLVMHHLHGRSEAESNIIVGYILANLGECVELIENNSNYTSPDATRNGILWEFKTISNSRNLRNAVQQQLRKGKFQCSNILIFINQLFELSEITFGIYNAVKYDQTERIQVVAVLFNNGRLVEFTRAEIVDKRYLLYFREKTKEDEQ